VGAPQASHPATPKTTYTKLAKSVLVKWSVSFTDQPVLPDKVTNLILDGPLDDSLPPLPWAHG
jgi:hypothetical protein